MLRLANEEPDYSYDRALDARQVELAREADCVIGSRLAMWLLPDADLRVFLAGSLEVRASGGYTSEKAQNSPINWRLLKNGTKAIIGDICGFTESIMTISASPTW